MTCPHAHAHSREASPSVQPRLLQAVLLHALRHLTIPFTPVPLRVFFPCLDQPSFFLHFIRAKLAAIFHLLSLAAATDFMPLAHPGGHLHTLSLLARALSGKWGRQAQCRTAAGPGSRSRNPISLPFRATMSRHNLQSQCSHLRTHLSASLPHGSQALEVTSQINDLHPNFCWGPAFGGPCLSHLP